MYAMMYAGSVKQPIESIIPAYLKLGESTINKEIEASLFEESVSPEMGYRAMERVVDQLLLEITDMHVPFTPTQDFERDCTYCPFQTICGTQWATRTTSP
jgi:hypothetical protein